MIQFNLLPDVKLRYIKARRVKRLVILIAMVVSAASLVVFLLMITTVDVVQKKSIHDLNNDINKYSTQLKSVPNLDKILTVQNQLNTLTSLHDQKVVASRLFKYLSQVTPKQASINDLNIDFQADTLTVSGTAPSLDVVNSYTDTLKATMYKTSASGSTETHAFNTVVLTSFGRSSSGATYDISLNFDPTIFSNASSVELTVPSGSSSNTSNLFQGGN